jgi:hypothetical protein
MSALTKNWPLLWKVYDHIVAHPEEWNQSFYANRTSCGTTFCFAGHAVNMVHEVTWPEHAFPLINNGPPGRIIPNVAAEELGLTSSETTELFCCMTTDPNDIRAILERWWEAAGT